MSAGAWFADTGVAAACVGGLLGLVVPAVIARVPEPAPEQDAPGSEQGGAADTAPKETYAAIGALPGLRWKSSIATAVVAGLLGARVGWGPELSFLLYLAVLGVALAVIDWRTRLLPTRLVAPSYAVVAALAAASAWAAGDWHALVTAALGWLVAGGTFFVLWFVHPAGLGYGDVRLSGVLGIALGWLGWAELLTGVYAGFLLGGVGGILLSALGIVDRKAYPFGPFMLLGALVGVLAGPAIAAWYG